MTLDKLEEMERYLIPAPWNYDWGNGELEGIERIVIADRPSESMNPNDYCNCSGKGPFRDGHTKECRYIILRDQYQDLDYYLDSIAHMRNIFPKLITLAKAVKTACCTTEWDYKKRDVVKAELAELVMEIEA